MASPLGGLKAIVAGGTAFAGSYGVAIQDGVVSQGEWIITATLTLVAVVGVYAVPNQNPDGSWSYTNLPSTDEIAKLRDLITGLVGALSAKQVITSADPAVQATPALAEVVAAAAPVSAPEPLPAPDATPLAPVFVEPAAQPTEDVALAPAATGERFDDVFSDDYTKETS